MIEPTVRAELRARDEEGTSMQRRAAIAARIALAPVGIALGALLFAGAALAGDAGTTAPDQTVVQLMPLIGSGTHPVEAQFASWGVGNG
jgi:hypothetical protein